jgi:hypothetical protein
LKAGRAILEADNATVHFKRVSKVCQCIREVEDRMLEVQHQRFEGFWLHIKESFPKNSATNAGKFNSHTQVSFYSTTLQMLELKEEIGDFLKTEDRFDHLI